MSDCVFCQIAAGDIETELLYEDARVVAFRDLNPQAPHHILVIPRRHIPTVNAITSEEDSALVGHVVTTATKLAETLGVAGDGYRLLFNCNEQGGQTVYHIHCHLIAGRQMQWPPG